MPDAQTSDTSSADTTITTQTETSAPAPQEGLDAARARIAALETELGTVTADRDGAAAQLAEATRDVTLLRERLDTARNPDRAMELLEHLARATEAQALVALAAAHSGRDASDLRTRAAVLLGVGVR